MLFRSRLEFRLRDYQTESDGVATEFADDGLEITFEDTVSVGDGTVLQYVSVPRESTDEARKLFEGQDAIERFRRLDGDEEAEVDSGRGHYEIRQTEAPLIAALTEFGGRVVAVEAADGDFHIVTEFPRSVSVREVVQRVTDVYQSADLEAQRSVSSPDESSAHRHKRILDELTDRQRTVLETAQFAGYFEWPRESTGEEVADALDLSPSTFSQHLRAGQRKTFEGLFGDS